MNDPGDISTAKLIVAAIILPSLIAQWGDAEEKALDYADRLYAAAEKRYGNIKL